MTDGDGKKWSWYCGRASEELVLILVPYDEIGKISILKLTGTWAKIDELLVLFKESRYVDVIANNAGFARIAASS